jgi:hypothetical protein
MKRERQMPVDVLHLWINGQRAQAQTVAPGAGIRKMIVDAQSQLGYMGSQNGRLGRVR